MIFCLWTHNGTRSAYVSIMISVTMITRETWSTCSLFALFFHPILFKRNTVWFPGLSLSLSRLLLLILLRVSFWQRQAFCWIHRSRWGSQDKRTVCDETFETHEEALIHECDNTVNSMTIDGQKDCESRQRKPSCISCWCPWRVHHSFSCLDRDQQSLPWIGV